MEDLQPEYLRFDPLRRAGRRFHLWVAAVLCAGVFAFSGAAAQHRLPPQRTLAIAHVRSGQATLRQQARTTFLLLALKNGKTKKIALTHPSEYRQGLNAPYAASVVAEIPGKLLIFTDTFASNPGNEQGQCGASETGERFLHVVSLTAPVRESLSVLVESCLLDIEPKAGTPAFDLPSRTLRLEFDVNNGKPAVQTYHIAADNSVAQ